eukprot:TRINITY_DN6839_c0_g1_i1.p1 TRINITY_DN6839_c0_g1~~TRINITY_DN6839_c0_g1_i1.p1  ORF type:complete len:445 (+),score=103.57 TRINITY_DN6839_c0_g1_i1:214-1548(+)
MATRPSPPKPYELARQSGSASSPPPSRATAGNSGDDGNVGAPPRVPSRPQSSPSSSSYPRSNYGPYSNRSGSYGGYGSSYGGYGNSSYSGYGGYSRYGSGRYGGYGSSYGTYGGGYGSSYGGGYGSGYGSGYGGYGRYGRGPDGPYGPEPPPPGGVWQNALDASHSGIQRFGSIIEGFSRFSGLLDANFDAVHGSFSSVIRLVDVFGEFLHVVRTFALFRALSGATTFIWRVLNHMIGREIDARASAAGGASAHDSLQSDFAKFEQRRRSWPWLVLIVASGCISLPVLILKFVRAVRHLRATGSSEQPELMLDGQPLSPELSSDSDVDGKGPRPGFDAPLGDRVPSSRNARAVHDFFGQNDMEISFRRGDPILILDRPFPDWWEGEANGRRGLFPANHCDRFRPVSPSSGAQSSGEAGSSSSGEPLEGDDAVKADKVDSSGRSS